MTQRIIALDGGASRNCAATDCPVGPPPIHSLGPAYYALLRSFARTDYVIQGCWSQSLGRYRGCHGGRMQ